MKTKNYLIASVAAGLVGLAHFANAQSSVYLIDFNTMQSGSYPDASTWNIYAAPGDVSGSISDTTGDSSAGITLSATGDFADSTGTGLYNDNGPAWTDSDASSGDFFWTGSDSHTDGTNLGFTVTFAGLTQGATVDLDIFASRSSANFIAGHYEYSTDNGATWAGFNVLDSAEDPVTTAGWDTNDTQSQLYDLDEDGYVEGRYMNIGGTMIGEDETLMVRVTNGATSSYAGINSMRLTSVIPEPSTYAMLFGLVAGCMMILRRRR